MLPRYPGASMMRVPRPHTLRAATLHADLFPFPVRIALILFGLALCTWS